MTYSHYTLQRHCCEVTISHLPLCAKLWAAVILALKIYDKHAYMLTTTLFLTCEVGKRIKIHDFYVRERLPDTQHFKVVNIKIRAFLDVTVNTYRRFGGKTLLRNVGNYLPVYKA
jgi:hypothetical protein